MSSLSSAWAKLSTSAEGDAGFLRLRVSSSSQPAVYAARRRADAHEALLLEISTQYLPAGLELPRAGGLDIGATPSLPGPHGRTCFHVALADERYRDVFAALAPDVLQEVLKATDDTEAARAFFSRIARWQAFLRDHGIEGLSAEAQRGLFGEIWLLNRLLDAGVPGTTLIESWRGPERDAHDLQLPSASIEVKTTKAGTPKAIPISSIKQLDDRGVPRLFLYLLQVEESINATYSLPELVSRIRSDLSGSSLALFEDKLFDVGYNDIHFVNHSPQRYAIRRERWFLVEDDFPRIREDQLPLGVLDPRYSVDIAACVPFEYEDASAMAFLTGREDE